MRISTASVTECLNLRFYLLLLGHVADVDRPLVELRHHEDRSDRLLLSVSDDGHLLGPLLKVLCTEPDG